MDIHFVSSLTPEDEIRLAHGLLAALASLLDQAPITYTLRIEAGGSRVFHHSHSPEEPIIDPRADVVLT